MPDQTERNRTTDYSGPNMLERLNYVQSILEDAQCFIAGETPEFGTHEDLKGDLLIRIRTALLQDVPALRKPLGWYERSRS